jgi:hypothetical protein
MESAGRKLWMGDISKNAQGVRVQDVKITGIPLTDAQRAAAIAALEQAHRVEQSPPQTQPLGVETTDAA